MVHEIKHGCSTEAISDLLLIMIWSDINHSKTAPLTAENFEQGIIAAIENIIDNPTDNNKKALKNLFSKGFDSNKATLFEMFQIGEGCIQQ